MSEEPRNSEPASFNDYLPHGIREGLCPHCASILERRDFNLDRSLGPGPSWFLECQSCGYAINEGSLK